MWSNLIVKNAEQASSTVLQCYIKYITNLKDESAFYTMQRPVELRRFIKNEVG